MKKSILICILSVLALLMVSCGPEPERLGEYSDFDFEGVPDLEEIKDDSAPQEKAENEALAEVKTTTKKEESVVEQNVDTSQLFACIEDLDCILVQPNKCCSCPLAMNRYMENRVDTLKLGQSASCEEDYLCGSCVDPKDLEAKCIAGQCIAEVKATEVFVEKIIEPQQPGETISFALPPVPETSNFKSLTVAPACQPSSDRHAIYIAYALKSPADVIIETKEIGVDADFKSLKEFGPLFDVEQNIVLCDGCKVTNTPSIGLDSRFVLRFKSDFKGTVTYSGEYTIDTSSASEYLRNEC